MRKMLFMTISMSAMLVAGFIQADAQAKWSVKNTVHIGGEGAWDYVTVDSQAHRLYVTRTSHTQVIDASSGKVLGDVAGQVRSHGVALVSALGRGFITDGGGPGAIQIFDLKTYTVLGKLAAMPDADGIIYDPSTKLVLAVSGDGGALMTIKADVDPASGKIDAPIELGGKPEFLAADGAGKVYINLVDKDMVAVVDLKLRKVVARWPVTPGGSPVGMVLDRKNHRLFIGCRKPAMLIAMSTEDGKIEAALPIGTGVDATKFDDGLAFASCGDGTLSVVGDKGGKLEVEQVVKTVVGARTMGIDMATHTIYLPTAEFETPEPGAPAGRPKPKPDTFMIVEVGR